MTTVEKLSLAEVKEALAESLETLALMQDTIRIALKTVGFPNVDSMTQFERASAMIDLAQEYNALAFKRAAIAYEQIIGAPLPTILGGSA